MDNNSNYTEKLVQYLDGELDEAEWEALRTELNNNAALQQELDNLLLTKAVIKNYGLKQKISGIHQVMMQEAAPGHTAKPVIRRLAARSMRIAAGFIVAAALFGLYQYLTVSAGNLYKDQYSAYEVPTMRGTAATGAIEKAYSEKEYDEVISLYRQTASPAVTEQFLAGQAYVNKADHANAIHTFHALLEKNKAANSSTLNDETEYYLALSYLKNNETAKALPLFRKIHDDTGHLYHSRVSGWYLFRLRLLNWKN